MNASAKYQYLVCERKHKVKELNSLRDQEHLIGWQHKSLFKLRITNLELQLDKLNECINNYGSLLAANIV